MDWKNVRRFIGFLRDSLQQPAARVNSCYSFSKLKIIVRNQTRGTVVAQAADMADTSEKRRTGLLKHSGLEPGEGLWIVPCESVHTFFMKFPIDLVYLDKALKVKKVRSAVPAWRLSACLSAHSILELPAGTIEQTKTAVGDTLVVEKAG
jgi:uncharacterized protein